MLLLRKLGGKESSDKSQQQKLRHAARQEALLGFSFSEEEEEEQEQTQTQPRPLALLTTLASSKECNPWEDFTDEELAMWEESITPSVDI